MAGREGTKETFLPYGLNESPPENPTETLAWLFHESVSRLENVITNHKRDHRNNWVQLLSRLFSYHLFLLQQSEKYTTLGIFKAPGRE